MDFEKTPLDLLSGLRISQNFSKFKPRFAGNPQNPRILAEIQGFHRNPWFSVKIRSFWVKIRGFWSKILEMASNQVMAFVWKDQLTFGMSHFRTIPI